MDSFTLTLNRFRTILNSRLRNGVTRIWVQGANASRSSGGNTRLLFTCFFTDNSQYEMRFLEVRNLRHYRIDGDIENEERLLNDYIIRFTKLLEDFIVE